MVYFVTGSVCRSEVCCDAALYVTWDDGMAEGWGIAATSHLMLDEKLFRSELGWSFGYRRLITHTRRNLCHVTDLCVITGMRLETHLYFRRHKLKFLLPTFAIKRLLEDSGMIFSSIFFIQFVLMGTRTKCKIKILLVWKALFRILLNKECPYG